MTQSLSENKGIAQLKDDDLRIYSVGISSGGVAEMRMAELNPDRLIIASTLDERGALFAKEQIEAKTHQTSEN